MEFAVKRPDVVRAVNQRWLLNFWLSHRGPHRVPPWQSVVVEKLSGQSPHLTMLTVSGEGDAVRFQIRFNGTFISQAYGPADQRGKYIDEIMPAAFRADGLRAFRRTADEGCPFYTIHDLTDRNGRLVQYERLLLPFAGDGRKVDRVLMSSEFVCLDGAFEGRNIMSAQMAPPALALAAKIEIGPA